MNALLYRPGAAYLHGGAEAQKAILSLENFIAATTDASAPERAKHTNTNTFGETQP